VNLVDKRKQRANDEKPVQQADEETQQDVL
jgi:hypothetical protein